MPNADQIIHIFLIIQLGFFIWLVPDDGGYLDADELLLALCSQLVGAALNLAVRPRLLLRRHHDPCDIDIQLKAQCHNQNLIPLKELDNFA